jgi:hypothetical protein
MVGLAPKPAGADVALGERPGDLDAPGGLDRRQLEFPVGANFILPVGVGGDATTAVSRAPNLT